MPRLVNWCSQPTGGIDHSLETEYLHQHLV